MYVYYQRTTKPPAGDYSGVVHSILERYHKEANLKVKEIVIKRDGFKRPYLPNGAIDFNYSHTKSAIVLVATEGPLRSVGIDMEPLERALDVTSVLDTAFTPNELTNAMPPLQRWTLKEAALKMYGTGFRLADPKDYEVITEDHRFRLYDKGRLILMGWFKTLLHDGHVVTICSQNDIHALCVCTGMMDKNKEGGL